MVERGPEKAGVGGSIPSLGIPLQYLAPLLVPFIAPRVRMKTLGVARTDSISEFTLK
jgi:hypothetical protein